MVPVAPVIDGHLDDDAWRAATPLTGFVQREPRPGQPASERTEVRIVTDGEAIYVGFWSFDSNAAAIVPGEKVRDVQLTNSDYVAMIFDTYRDRQNGFVFATTPAGVEYDGQVSREGEGGGVFQTGQTRAQAGAMGGFNLNWDGSWTVATSRDADGWYAEFRIPFTTLRYGAGDVQAWGLNFARLVRRTNQEVFWSFIPQQFNLYRLSLAGSLDGLHVPPRRVATITPFVVGSQREALVAPTSSELYRAWGADAKIGLTPSLTLDLTYNTDFAQVEVDDQRVNLTRFPLFFPEKRPFFLENAGIFSAGTPQAVDLFFSRRIGIDSAGQPRPIIGGGRLSGRVGQTTVGLLQIFTNDAPGSSGQSYTVARVMRELGARSRIGIIGVQRQGTSGPASVNRTLGLDGRLGLSQDVTLDAWGARTESGFLGRDDFAFSARAEYNTRRWTNSARMVSVGSDFNPEVGFLNRAGGYRYYELAFLRSVRRPEWTWFRQWFPHVNYRGYHGLDGVWQSGQLHFDVTEVEFSNGARFGPEMNSYHENLQAPFEISKGIVLPPGSYDYTGIALDLQTDPSEPFSLVLRGDFGPFYNGRRNGGIATLTWRRGATLSTSLMADYNDVHLFEGDFVRTLYAARVAWFFTPRIYMQTLAQYNNQAAIWSANARFAWLSTAGTGLFIVVNDSQEATGPLAWTRPQSRSLTVKFTRQIGTGG